jgi:hypothetical protein
VADCSLEGVGWWNGAGTVSDFFADAVFVYRVTGDELVKEAVLAVADAMNRRERAVAVKFVRSLARDVRDLLVDEAASGSVTHRLEQLASEMSLRGSIARDGVRDRRASDLRETLETILGSWRAYWDTTVVRRLLPKLFNSR